MSETNPVMPFSEIEIGGKNYKMCFGYDALADAETKLLAQGHDVNINFCLPRLTFANTRILFAASLLHYQPDIDFKASLALVTRDNNITIVNRIIEAWNLNTPEVEESAGDPPQLEP
jgi:hypothetical protein